MAVRDKSARSTTTEYRPTGSLYGGTRLSHREAARVRAERLRAANGESGEPPAKVPAVVSLLGFAIIFWALFIVLFWWAFI